MAKKEKQSINEILSELEKKYGLENRKPEDYIVTSTGSVTLDREMGIGGTALGKIVEIFGPESSGKSTITLHQIAQYQKAYPEKFVALMDYEHSFDRKYASRIGVDVENLLIYQPDSQEIGYDLALNLIQKDIVSCIVIDSQTAAAPKAIIDGEMTDNTMALQARNNSKFCLKVKGLLSIHNCSLFFVSQLRDNIGGMGETSITTGGKAIRFYSDVRWKVWKMNDKAHEMNKTTIDIVKNKLSAPFGQAKIDILWGIGFDKIGEIINFAVELNMIQKGGAWLTLSDGTKLQGMDAAREYFSTNADKYEALRKEVIEKLPPRQVRELQTEETE